MDDMSKIILVDEKDEDEDEDDFPFPLGWLLLLFPKIKDVK